MATFLTQQAGKEFLDFKMGSVYTAPGDSELVLYTVPPTKVGTDGTELAGGGYDAPLITVGAAVNGTSGRTAQITNTNGLLFSDMPVDFADITGFGLRTPGASSPWLVNDSWTPTDTAKLAGESLFIPAGALTVFSTN